VPAIGTVSVGSRARVPPEARNATWLRRISDCPLKSPIRKPTSRAPTALASAVPITSAATIGGAASTAESSPFTVNGAAVVSPWILAPFSAPRLPGLGAA
jgi:hypothetical protein